MSLRDVSANVCDVYRPSSLCSSSQVSRTLWTFCGPVARVQSRRDPEAGLFLTVCCQPPRNLPGLEGADVARRC